jgi:hypothetical protein
LSVQTPALSVPEFSVALPSRATPAQSLVMRVAHGVARGEHDGLCGGADGLEL